MERIISLVQDLCAQHNGIVTRKEFIRQLQATGLSISPKTFYSILHEQVGVKKFRVAIQKRGEDPRRVRAETYYVSPAFYKLDTPLALYRVMHNFIMERVKNFLSVTFIVKDIARLDKKTNRLIISDLEVQFGSRKFYVEYTSGGRAAMRKAIRKIAESPHKRETVLLVGLEKQPRRQQAGVCVTSNRQEALAIAAERGVKIRVFTLTKLEELETYFMTGKLPYIQ